MANLMWTKLQTIASCSDGIFCSGSVTKNQTERKALNQIVFHNKEMFKLIRMEKAAIYQLSGLFYSRYRLPLPNVLFGKLCNSEILRRCIWSAFIIENQLNAVLPSHPFIFNGRQILLDDYHDRDKYKCNVILTSEDRYGFFAAKGMECIVPSLCMSKWVRKVLGTLFIEMPIDGNIKKEFIADIKGKQVVIPEEFVVQNGFWPKSNDECHQDKKNYGNLGNLTGVEKWQMDQAIIPLWAKERKHYKNIKFGIYEM